ncbi:hypothetical protein EVAR_94095_1 [Eumeta japonica]|uniref:Uncharacterized protein n=1 Tax=Eumeta variegata TaxID=151549 RepID=A0A4C1V5L6_EUMVA|nr:hypothetical protein EVAR_94095_1 [Eumeta japonica]
MYSYSLSHRAEIYLQGKGEPPRARGRHRHRNVSAAGRTDERAGRARARANRARPGGGPRLKNKALSTAGALAEEINSRPRTLQPPLSIC